MTSEKSYLINIKPVEKDFVTFGDGACSRVLGKYTLIVNDLLKLKNILLVEGLQPNPISISQMCDSGVLVKFNKNSCLGFDGTNETVMQGPGLLITITCYNKTYSTIMLFWVRLSYGIKNLDI